VRAFVSLRAGDLFAFGPGAPESEPEEGNARLSVSDLEKALLGTGGRFRFVAPAARHLTLKFLGDVDEGLTRDLGKALAAAASTSAPFPVGARGVGFFPNAHRAKVIWVGLDDPDRRIAPLHEAIEASFEGAGVERTAGGFVPHITVARVVRAPPGELLARAVDPLVATRFGWSRAEGVELVQSTLTPKGPVYKTLSRHPFGRGTA
jgi:2'-5' RNA ligase